MKLQKKNSIHPSAIDAEDSANQERAESISDKIKDMLVICIGQFRLLSTEIRLRFVASCFAPTLQQTVD